MSDEAVRALPRLKKNADRERIARRVSKFMKRDEAPATAHVMPLNKGFFALQRMRGEASAKRRSAKKRKVTGK